MRWDSMPDTVRVSHVPSAGELGFGGFLSDFRTKLEDVPLTSLEKASPLHWKPALDFMLEKDFDSTRTLAEKYGRLSAERFGFSGDCPPLIEFADMFLSGKDSSVWVKVEWKPFARPIPEGMSDRDGDGFYETFARLDPAQFRPGHFSLLSGEYSSRVLTESEVMNYGHELAAYWYPSRNTDFQDLRGLGEWPGVGVELELKKEAGPGILHPIWALRGKPHGSPVYFVITVRGMGESESVGATTRDTPTDSDSLVGVPLVGTLTEVSDNVGEYLASITDRENEILKKQGNGSWSRWQKRLQTFHRDIKGLLDAQPASILAFPSPVKKNVLIFRRELEYLLAGDLASLPDSSNPIQIISAFRDSLASLGIDFLFVPIPTKQDVKPSLVSKAAVPKGVAQPYLRKFLFDLASAKVETVDLLSRFREAANSGDDSLYQRQDTHWTAQGLELAAAALAERVMGYAWFGEVYSTETAFTTRDTVFTQMGDLVERLPVKNRTEYGPESLRARQVLEPDGKLYKDKPEAPVLILGDSYTGVFQLTGCRNAGVTAHLAKAISGPVDLIMGWGGGPEAVNKLRRAGSGALRGKRLVIWMMSARDLFVYPGGWKPGA